MFGWWRKVPLETLLFLYAFMMIVYIAYAVIDMVASGEALSEEYPRLLFCAIVVILSGLAIKVLDSLFAERPADSDTGLTGVAKLLVKAAVPLAAIFFVAAIVVLIMVLSQPSEPGGTWIARYGVFATVSLAFCTVLLGVFHLATRPVRKEPD